MALCNLWTPMYCIKAYKSVIGTNDARMKLGTDVVTVARILVPNCSEALVINTAQ